MSTRKILVFMSMILAIAVFAWTSGDALAQQKDAQPDVSKVKRVNPDVVKGKATRDDVSKYLGKVTPSEQAAAAKRARQLGLLPGIAGRSIQAPLTAPPVQAP